jgi:hypothetical protein
VLGEDVELPSTYRTGLRLIHHAVDLRAFLVLWRRGELSPFAWLRSLMHPQTPEVFHLADPLPSIIRSEVAQRAAVLMRSLR